MKDIQPARSIVVERTMPHPPEKIWRALTEGALIAEWLMRNDFRPIVGHRFNFWSRPVAGWNGVADCKDEAGYRAMSGGWPRVLDALGRVAGGLQ